MTSICRLFISEELLFPVWKVHFLGLFSDDSFCGEKKKEGDDWKSRKLTNRLDDHLGGGAADAKTAGNLFIVAEPSLAGQTGKTGL